MSRAALRFCIYVWRSGTFDSGVELQSTSVPPVLRVQPASYVEPLALGRLFPPGPIEIELGAGDGSFLIQWAKINPAINFLGVERLLGRLRKIERKAVRAGLSNVRLIRLEAAYFTEYLVPPESVGAFHIYFPDPWPKRKHRRHRLINDEFASVLAARLTPGGVVYLRTDDRDYFAQMLRVFGANSRFAAAPTPEPLAAVVTDFERGFNTLGIVTQRAAFRRTS